MKLVKIGANKSNYKLSRMLTSNNSNASSSSAATISQHFYEMKEDIVSFNESFTAWLEDKRRLIHDDKNVYLKTLAEEHGKCLIIISIC